MKAKKIITLALLVGTVSGSLTGCIKPYQEPIYEEIGTSESAFLIPLVGDTEEQSNFESEELLEKNKVATKRVQIPTEWVKLNRFYWQGEYRPTMKLIKVDRTAVSREWTEAKGDGTSSQNQGIIAESKSSISFMARISCIANIEEKNVAKFLYNYNSKTLSEIMDTEIRTVVESKFNEECAKREMDQILADKSIIMESVTNYTTNLFATKGITITNIGFKGEFTYLDENIQASINKKFTATQEAEAQAIINKKNEDQAQSEAKVIQSQSSTLDQTIKLKEAEAKVLEAQAKIKQAEAMSKWNVQVLGDNPIITKDTEK